ncbi:hypothetical protein E1258_17910 [Micromonospora sp. KC207]|nr:hypothetical protein E1258_17910 [Micromonospora sp. KC207]
MDPSQVRQLVRDWLGIGLSLVTIGKYLRSWGLSPQKPIRRVRAELGCGGPVAGRGVPGHRGEGTAGEGAHLVAGPDWAALGRQCGYRVGAGRQAAGGPEDRQAVRGQRDGHDQ